MTRLEVGNGPIFAPAQPFKGGVVRVIDSATGDISRSTAGFIEDEKYNTYFEILAGTGSAEFDSSVTRTGRLTLKSLTTSAAGRIRVGNADLADNLGASQSKYWVPIKPNTAYKFRIWVKTDNAATNSVFANLKEANSSFAVGASLLSSKLSGTNDWTLLTINWTSASTASFVRILLRTDVAGDAQATWWDVNSMTIEEVSTITNPLASPVFYYPRVTAVTSTDNVDQSQLVVANTGRLGEVATKYQGQSFTPTKKNFTGLVFQRGGDTGTFTGDVTVAIRTNSANAPTTTVLGSVTYPNALWSSLAQNTDIVAPIELTLTPGTLYWIVINSSTGDNANYTRLVISSTDIAGLLYKPSADGITWSTDALRDLYFKTLYSKNTTNFTIRTDTQTLSYSAPTTDGWPDGTVLDARALGLTPLTLAAGANNIYYSSNGPATADGTVDPSLQMLVSKNFFANRAELAATRGNITTPRLIASSRLTVS